MQQIAFTHIFSPLFGGFCSRMWLDHCDENKAYGSITQEYPEYVLGNLKFLIRKFNEQNGNKDWNIK